MRVNSVISILPKLTPQELTLVKAAIDSLLGHEGNSVPDLYKTITGALGSKLPWGTFRAGPGHKAYQRGANAVTAYIQKHWGNERSVTQQAIQRFMLDTLLEDLKARGAPLTVSVVVSNLDRLPALFSQQFPDYLETGLAGVIAKAMRRK